MDVLVGVGLGSNQDTNWIGLIGMDAACPESYPVRAHRAVIKLHPLEVALEDLNQACQSDCEHQSVTAQSQHSDRTVTAQSQHSHSTVTAQSQRADQRHANRICEHQSASGKHGGHRVDMTRLVRRWRFQWLCPREIHDCNKSCNV